MFCQLVDQVRWCWFLSEENTLAAFIGDRGCEVLTMFCLSVCLPASGMKVKQTVDKMATVADSLSEGGIPLCSRLQHFLCETAEKRVFYSFYPRPLNCTVVPITCHQIFYLLHCNCIYLCIAEVNTSVLEVKKVRKHYNVANSQHVNFGFPKSVRRGAIMGVGIGGVWQFIGEFLQVVYTKPLHIRFDFAATLNLIFRLPPYW